MGNVSTALGAVVELALPLSCAGCGRHGIALCDGCARNFAGNPFVCDPGAPALAGMADPVPVWAVTAYVDRARDVILAWKNGGRSDLTPYLAAALVRAGAQVVGPAASSSMQLTIVPAPSTLQARIRRGAFPVAELADLVARWHPSPARCRSILALRGSSGQLGLGARARRRNRSGAMTARGRARGSALIIDDVVTTGATIVAAVAALRAAGWLVCGAVVLAATPPPRTIVSDPFSFRAHVDYGGRTTRQDRGR